MKVLVLLILASLSLAALFLVLFVWAVRSGQYEDTCTPSMRLLTDEPTSSAGKVRRSVYPDQEIS